MQRFVLALPVVLSILFSNGAWALEALPPEILRKGTWASQPTEADIAAAYPKAEQASLAVGLTCTLQDEGLLNYCTFDNSVEVPEAFQIPALQLVRKFRVSLQDQKKYAAEYVRVKLSIRFIGSLPFVRHGCPECPTIPPPPLPPPPPPPN